MVQGGQRLGFAREALEAIRIRGEEIRQDLDGDIAVERRVLRAVDLAHPAGAELGNDFVRTDVRTWRTPAIRSHGSALDSCDRQAYSYLQRRPFGSREARRTCSMLEVEAIWRFHRACEAHRRGPSLAVRMPA